MRRSFFNFISQFSPEYENVYEAVTFQADFLDLNCITLTVHR